MKVDPEHDLSGENAYGYGIASDHASSSPGTLVLSNATSILGDECDFVKLPRPFVS
jgi:hypothetical protein